MVYVDGRNRRLVRRFSLGFLAALTLFAVPASAGASTYINSTPISIPGTGTGPGASAPYPSTIAVSGVPGAVVKARATLIGVTHTYPNDIQTLLVGPSGLKTNLMSNRCEAPPLTGQTFTLDDSAPTLLPEEGPCPSGIYKPSKDAGFDPTFEPPAPPGPQTVAAMSALNGGPANGTWQLFVRDQQATNTGSIGGGWSLDLLTDAKCAGKPATLTGTGGPDQLTGTPDADVILGFDGKDTIKGLEGKDVACGGNGKDTLKGGKAKDTLLGQKGADTLKGGGGNDTCKGGKGDDVEKSC